MFTFFFALLAFLVILGFFLSLPLLMAIVGIAFGVMYGGFLGWTLAIGILCVILLKEINSV